MNITQNLTQNLTQGLTQGLTHTRTSIEEYLKQILNRGGALYEAMNYGVFSGGKRLRALLTATVYSYYKEPLERILPYACAIELIHSYSLIHDDLPSMDNDDERRGKPTAHKRFGEAAAILAGDALLTKAFEIMAADIFTEFSPAKVLAMRNIARAAGAEGMVGGQVLDIAGSPEVVEMERKKTGELFRVCLETGALIGGADNAAEVDALGRDLGLAFQIKDDIDDYGEDKVTYVTKFGLQRSKKDFNGLREKILSAGLFGGSPASELVAGVLGDAFEEN